MSLKLPIIILNENPPSGFQVVTRGQTDGWTGRDMGSIIGPFFSFALRACRPASILLSVTQAVA